jgi:indolepyruvate ferredoxin oxidoreductase beta subunit
MPVISAKAAYPDGIFDELTSKVPTTVVNAGEEAKKLGNAKVMNIILLGAAIKLMGLEKLSWDEILGQNMKPTFLEVNLRALELGKKLVA